MSTRLSLWLLLATLAASAAEPEVTPQDLPRIPPTEPDKALSTFRIKPGFRLELAAAEPLVVDPIAMAFDEKGRLFVVEMRDYSERRPERLGRIRLLEDTDADGRLDQSTVFADKLPWPTAVTCYDGGIFVGATPDILYFKDTSGDGKADLREIVFTGFASDYAPFATNKLNVQALMNSFQWSLDNRIHGATGPSGGKVQIVDSAFTRRWRERAVRVPPSPGGEGRGEGGQLATRNSKSETRNAPLDLRGRDFSFDPRTLELRAESGGGQHGMSFDNRGRKFVCSNSDHIQLIAYEERYAGRNPYFDLPSPRISIAVDGPAAEVYRLSPDEPWRVLRTKWRVAGTVPGPVEGGGRASGYFTGATGITIYRGSAFPDEFLGDAFIADCGSNLIHRKKLRPAGVLLKAERPADEQKVEFLASTDNWFRPVQFANAPDGCLYLADMYREVIEHPWSLPPSIKKHLDLNSGNDRGRIYRIVPENFQRPKLPRLGQLTTMELVKTLEHPNGWHRDTAARLLYERQNPAAISSLEKLLLKSKAPLGRLHALSALAGQSALKSKHVLSALGDSDAAVRETGVRLAGHIVNLASAASPVEKRLFRLASDPSPRVRYQLAFNLGAIFHAPRSTALAGIIRRAPDDPWVQAAVLNSLGVSGSFSDAGTLFAALSRDPAFRGCDGGRNFLRQLTDIIGEQNHSNDVAGVLQFLDRHREPALAYPLLGALADGLRRASNTLTRADASGRSSVILAQAARDATDARAPDAARTLAIPLLALKPSVDAIPALCALLDSGQPHVVQLTALATLDRFAEPQLGGELLKHWATFSPRLRADTMSFLLKRPARVAALLTVLEQGTVRPGELSAAQTQFLRTHREERLRQRAVQVLGKAPVSSRQEAVETFQSALTLSGDAKRGGVIYLSRCAACHRAGTQGHALGPDLVTIKTAGKEKLLINILDPDREVAPGYLSYLVETKDGETLTGLIGNETATSVTLRHAGGVETVVLRPNIARMQSQGQSVMPEGLEKGLSQQDFADLLEFIVAP